MSSDRSRVVILNAMSEAAFELARKRLEAAGHEVIVSNNYKHAVEQVPYGVEELQELVRDADVLFISGSTTKITREVLAAEPSRLRAVVTSSLGYNCVDVEACSELGVIVSNSPVETNYEGVVQHTLMLVLALRRRLGFFQEWAKEGRHWTPMGIPEAPELLDEGTTLGVVGFGRIGYRVARLFRDSFRTKVLAYDPYVAEDRAQEIGVTLVDSLDELLRDADIVTLHTLLSKETERLMGEKEFRLMKSTACVINTSRGSVVEEGALLAALQCGQIGGAALDVTEGEPLAPASPLLGMENVIITPHVAGASIAHTLRGTEFATSNALRALAGRVPKVVVNPEAIELWAERFKIRDTQYGGRCYYGLK